MTNSTSKLDATQTAEDWLTEKQVFTVPLYARKKKPIGYNWEEKRLGLDDIPHAFKIGNNIGALWGACSNNAIDLDLDLDTAPLVAPHILPETFIYGRRDKRFSHHVFRCPGAVTKKYQIKGIGMVLEIRADGSQSVIPPSIHPDGDRYFIEDDREFYDLSKAQLERYADEIAIASVYLHLYPESGMRHDYVHACTGALCHQGWSEEKIKRVMAAVLSEVQDDDEELSDRMVTVVNTIEHYEMGDRVQGFKSLEDFMDMHVLMALRRWSKKGGKERKLEITPTTTIKPKAKEPTDVTFREEWLDVPGLVGDIMAWSAKRSFIQQPMFDLATGLMCTALASCNNYLVDGWDTPLQPYIMITAPTGDGKGATLSAIQKFATALNLDDAVRRGFQSYYAMLDELAEPPAVKCWLWDEAARHMASAKSPASVDYQTLSHVISLYGQADEYVPATPGRNRNIPALDRPFLTVFATAQPDQLMEALTSAAEETGVVNRFILFDSGIEFPPRNRHRSNVFPSAIKKQAIKLRDHEPRNGRITKVRFIDNKTFALFDTFEEEARRKAHNGEKVWARANQNALILAGIVAVGVNADRPKITADIARWALDVTTWSCNVWAKKVRSVGGNNQAEADLNKVQYRIQNCRDYLKTAQSPPHKKYITAGWMPHTVLKRLTKTIPGWRLEQILDDLIEAEIITSREEEDGNITYAMK